MSLLMSHVDVVTGRRCGKAVGVEDNSLLTSRVDCITGRRCGMAVGVEEK